MERYPDTIELTPNATGVYHPDFSAAPSQPLAIYEPPVNPAALNQLPPPVSSYDSGSKGLSDADIADFGTDEYGRPNVVRDRNGRATWNPDIELPKSATDGIPEALDNVPNNRTARRSVGRAANVVGEAFGTFANAADAVSFFRNLPDPYDDPIGPSWSDDLLKRWGEFSKDLVLGKPYPTGKPSGTVSTEGEPEFQGGQCPETYRVVWSGRAFFGSAGSTPTGGSVAVNGPIQGIYTNLLGTSAEYRIKAGGQDFRLQAYSKGGQDATAATYTIDEIFFFDPRRGRINKPDNCGNPAGPVTDKPTTPTKTRDGEPERDSPPNYDAPPRTIYDPPRIDGPETDGPPELEPPPETAPPEVPDLPPETDPPEKPDPPTKQPECCPSTELSLAEIKALLSKVLSLVRGSGSGSLDLKPCDYEAPVIPFGQSGLEQPEVEPMTADYEGAGVQGIFDAIAAITQSLNLIHTDTKCPPEVTAALPMFWELKRGEIPQLVVAWTKVEGGTSKWSMTIPHPREDIDSRYPFSFPVYKKGGNMASVRLIDNSQVIVNAFSEAEAQRIIDYIETLIDPAFIPADGLRMVYSKNVADYVEADVRASYVKKFLGHKTTAPLWGRTISSV